jgi:hypothetical protein
LSALFSARLLFLAALLLVAGLLVWLAATERE